MAFSLIAAPAEVLAQGSGADAKDDREETNGIVVEFDIDDAPPTRLELTPTLRAGMSVQIESAFEDNYDLDDMVESDLGFGEAKWQAALTYEPIDYLQAYVNFSLNSDFVFEEEGPKRAPRETSLKLRHAHVTFNGHESGFAARVGRQRLKDEREWLYDDDLDSANIFYRNGAFGLEVAVNRKGLVDLDVLRDEFEEKTTNYFANLKYALDEDNTLGAYVIVRDGTDTLGGQPIFFGAHALGEIDRDLKYWVQVGGVTGKSERDPTTLTRDDLSGFGFDLGGSYRFRKTKMRPYIGADIAFGTGDADTSSGKDKNYRQTGLQDNAGRFHGVTRYLYYGELLDPELSNLIIPTVAVGMRPTRRSSIDLVYHHYRQHKASDELRDAEISMDPNGIDKAIGQEIDLVVGVRDIKNLNIELVGGYFMPSEAFPGADNAWLARAEVRYRLF